MGAYQNDIDNSSAIKPAKGSQEWMEEQPENNSSATTPAKGTQEWSEQNSGENAPQSALASQKKDVSTGDAASRQTTTASGSMVGASGSTDASGSSGGGDAPSAGGYDSIIKELEDYIARYKPLSKEELEKLRRRQKTEGIISSISDAARSVANLIFTHHYAPNMFNAKEGMSVKAQERFEKERAEREAKDEKYFNYALNIARLKHETAKDKRNWDHMLEREKIADDLEQAKSKRDGKMEKLRMDLMQGKIDQQRAAAEAARIEANFAEELAKARVETEKEKSKNYRASASANNERASYYRSGGNRREYTLNLGGEIKRYGSVEDYEREVNRLADNYKIDKFQNVRTTETNIRGRASHRDVSTRKPIAQLAADVEAASAADAKGYSTDPKKEINNGKGITMPGVK